MRKEASFVKLGTSILTATLIAGCGEGSGAGAPSGASFSVGGTISGLTGIGLVLQLNSKDNTQVATDGAFSFSTLISNGTDYTVTVLSQPADPTQICTVTDGTGTATAAVNDIQVTCAGTSSVADEWEWRSGSDTINQRGTYGTQGTSSPSNVPGARVNASSWTDASGNLWLFGGYGEDSTGTSGDLNDLWKYSDGNWAWVSGSNLIEGVGNYGTLRSASPSGTPGARYEAVSWTDSAGNFWIFGGLGLDSTGTRGYLNDLWEYSGGEWIWVSGSNTVSQTGIYGTAGVPSNIDVPGARVDAVAWADALGNFWIFGGLGYDSTGTLGILNDLWKYSGGQWTWIGGSNVVNQLGVYGTLGVASANNNPGARTKALGWAASDGALWLFGGQGNDSNGLLCKQYAGSLPCDLNDVWTFKDGSWTWVAGSNIIAQSGIYGSMGAAANANTPGSRFGATGWVDSTGGFWLFGGNGFDSTTAPSQIYGDLNDLWRFSQGEWTWISGSSHAGQAGSYGSLGAASTGAAPGARDGAVSWIDAQGDLWLFGGANVLSVASGGSFNDLWEYQP